MKNLDFATVARGVDAGPRGVRPAHEPEGPQERRERAVLGGLLALLAADAAPHFAALDEGDFTFPQHAAIYRALFTLHARGTPLTTTATVTALEAAEEPESYRDPAFIDDLGRVGDGRAMAEAVAALKEATTRRRVMPELRAAQTAAAQGLPLDVVAELTQSAASAAAEGGTWPSPTPLDEGQAVPFPRDVLRGPLARFAEALALAYQVPLDMPAVLGLGALSVTLGNRVAVRLRGGWTEPVNLFVASVMPPASRKSGVVRAVLFPFNEREQRLARELARSIEDTASALRAAEKDLAKAESARDPVERQRCVDAVMDARERLVLPPRYYTDDATPEVLTSLLAAYGGSFSVVTAEGGELFDMMAGKYSANGSANLGVYLKGHAGDSIRVDRKGRAAEHIRNPALTVAVAAQPEALRVFASRPELRGRGLTARFLYSIPPSNIGYRDTDPPPLDPEVVWAWSRLINAMLDAPSATSNDGEPAVHLLRPDQSAAEILGAFRQRVERRLGSDLAELPDWGGKLAGAAVRLAGVMHAAELTAAGRTFWTEPLGADAMERAVFLAEEYFVPHAKHAFQVMDATPAVENARKLLEALRRRGQASFKAGEALHIVARNGTRKEHLDPALDALLSRGWIRLAAREEGKRGRPPEMYLVHPCVLRAEP